MRSLALSAFLFASFAPAQRPTREFLDEFDHFCEREANAKGVPALAVVLVDAEARLLSPRGYGAAKHANADHALFAAGPLAEPITALAVVQRALAGDFTLDSPAPIRNFQPAGRTVTLRQLLAHRAGLPRHASVGSPWSEELPVPLATAVASLNNSEPLFAPGSKERASYAGIAAAGFALEQRYAKPFPDFVQGLILDRATMSASQFRLQPLGATKPVPAVSGASWDRPLPVPLREQAEVPAVGLFATARDLGQYLMTLLDTPPNRRDPAFTEMLRVQFEPPTAIVGQGLGFYLDRLGSDVRARRVGSVPGGSTAMVLLPGRGLGVVVLVARDPGEGLASRIADAGIAGMLASRTGQPLPDLRPSPAIPADDARRAAGRYRAGPTGAELIELAGQLWLRLDAGGPMVEVRQSPAGGWTVDDLAQFGPAVQQVGNNLRVGGTTYQRVPPSAAAVAPERLTRWVGRYALGANRITPMPPVTILEREGALVAIVETGHFCPLREAAGDRFAFADGTLMAGESIDFQPGGAVIGGVPARLVVPTLEPIPTPTRSLLEIVTAARSAAPPPKRDEPREPELVDLAEAAPGVCFDLTRGIAGRFDPPVLLPKRLLLQRPAAAALASAQAELAKQGYGLVVFDAYRPWYVSRALWEAGWREPFVDDPQRGERRNRGGVVEVGLVDAATGVLVDLPSAYGATGPSRRSLDPGGTSRQRYHRDLLRQTLEGRGFQAHREAWWRFDFLGADKYPVGNGDA